jgi:phosphoribosyl-ATP pyrophosphohydrolase
MATTDPDAASDVPARIAATIESRKGAEPAGSYVASMFARGDDAILKKIGEEATDTVVARQDGSKIRIDWGIADRWWR